MTYNQGSSGLKVYNRAREKEAYIIILSTHPDKINSSSVPWSLKLYSEATVSTENTKAAAQGAVSRD